MIQPSDPALKGRLTLVEGRIRYAYQDSEGYWTIAIGHLIDHRKGGGLPDAIIDALYDYDAVEKFGELDAVLPWWRALDDARQRVMAELAFNMGAHGVAGFPNFCAAMQAQDWPRAGAELKDSKAYGEEPHRFDYLIGVINTGVA
jgi:lysozyme